MTQSSEESAVEAPRAYRERIGGTELAWFEWPARPGCEAEPAILLVHATGFHARCWDGVVEHLGGRRVIALDMRGHGRSAKTPPYTWDTFGADLAAFVDHLGLTGAVGVGHSMGGYCVVGAAAERPETFSRLVLIDPVILSPEAYAERAQWPEGETHPTARRRNRWRDWREMYERFRDRRPFSEWRPQVLEDYCRHGLSLDPDDGWVLACPPEVEASIYMGSTAHDIFAMVASVQVPVTVLRARERTGDRDPMDFSTSPTWPELARHFPRGRDVHLPETSHFLPMEDPERVAGYVLDRC